MGLRNWTVAAAVALSAAFAVAAEKAPSPDQVRKERIAGRGFFHRNADELRLTAEQQKQLLDIEVKFGAEREQLAAGATDEKERLKAAKIAKNAAEVKAIQEERARRAEQMKALRAAEREASLAVLNADQLATFRRLEAEGMARVQRPDVRAKKSAEKARATQPSKKPAASGKNKPAPATSAPAPATPPSR
jgi:hypothetical protein